MKTKLFLLALLSIGFINLPGCSDVDQGEPEFAAEQQKLNEEAGDAYMTPEEEANEQ